jgi:anionic cell wall polymer biosynthesis LytR-Cps2A-Psr (LCP) family protein
MGSKEAIDFSTMISPFGRWDSLDRQTQVLKGLFEKALEPSNLLKAPELIGSFGQAVTTDLSPELGTDLICLAEAVTAEQIAFYGVGDTYALPNTDGSVSPRIERIEELLVEAFGN